MDCAQHDESCREFVVCFRLAQAGYPRKAASRAEKRIVRFRLLPRSHNGTAVAGMEPDDAWTNSFLHSFYAAACFFFCPMKFNSSSLISCLWVEHIPCGAPAITFRVAPFTSFAESSAESAMGTI
jgi:hypothetical protein